VSRIIISELDCSRRGTSRRQVKLNSAKLTKAGHNRLGQVGAFIRLLNRINEDRAHLSLHGPAMPCGPDAKPFHNPVVQVPDTHRCHEHHLLDINASIRMPQ
jgi:hypothetical protein